MELRVDVRRWRALDCAEGGSVREWCGAVAVKRWVRDVMLLQLSSEWMLEAWMAKRKEFDRHSWSGSSVRLSSSRLHYQLPDFVLPLRILKLDPADRAVLRIAGPSRSLSTRPPRSTWYKRHETVDCPSVCPVDRWQAGLLHAEVGRGQQISIIAAPAAPTCGPRNFWSDCKEVQRRRFA